MMKQFLILSILVLTSSSLFAQVQVKTNPLKKDGYHFTLSKNVECTEVKSQGRTGTCWSFANSSFLEAEMIRSGVTDLNLSEMFTVRNIYKEKARNYVLRQGKANFSQGSLLHDVINSAERYGLIPEEAYSGKKAGEEKHDHSELVAVLKGMLDGVIKQRKLSSKWSMAFESVLDAYLGDTPQNFTYKGKKYTPTTFASSMGLDFDKYVSLTSYTHHPFYDAFILEIPDNFSNGSFHNVPMDEMMAVIDHALEQGYSVSWDGDVSEKGFSGKEGLALLPVDVKREDLFEMPGEELEVTQDMRQETFLSYETTDDHLMHITGIAHDQKGNKYYLIKNSWGEISHFKGYLYMSEAYMRLKTVAIMLHREALPKKLAKKIL